MLSTFDRRHALKALGVTAAGAATGFPAPFVRAQGATIQMVSHRYPALEHYAAKMQSALPGVEVNTQLMPFDKANELATIALSSGASTFDIVYANDSTVLKYAKNGWLRPIDDLFEKYKDEFNFADYPESVLDSYRYKGELFVLPHTANVMLFFYRKDLFEEAGAEVPTTMEEYEALAAQFNSPARAGTISCQKPVDASLNEIHWYMSTIGDGWFDENLQPVFNSPNGVAAIETLKRITANAQRGFTSAANDECTIALQQDLAVMGLQWATRCASMDDPAKSRVVGLIDWAAAPGGHTRLGGDGYGISAYTSQDPDQLFRILAISSSYESMSEAASMMVPPRSSILNDPAVAEKYRHFPGVLAALETAQPFPSLPEFYELGETITRRVHQAITDEMEVQAALDAAAAETIGLLRDRGYDL
ncbi:MAG TPA: extracellular solute-binding protein [Geminicoccaceae bacterium]|nr:extracellular solute-binding protein [Geminicoccaceae bacterium]